mgnify:CR=1 FL=1
MSESNMIRTTTRREVTFAGSDTSNAISINGFSAGLWLELPASFSGTAVTFLSVDENENDLEVYKAGSAVTVAVDAGKINRLPADDLFGLAKIKIVSDAIETLTATLLCTA